MPKNSPTLERGERYLSVTAAVPPALSERIFQWQRVHGVDEPRVNSHITVQIAAVHSVPELPVDFLRTVREFLPFSVELGKPQTFLPHTAVSFFPIADGLDTILNLHQVCTKYLGVSASPFEFVPHLTIAHGLAQSELEKSLRDFANLPAENTSFQVTELDVNFFDGKKWGKFSSVSST